MTDNNLRQYRNKHKRCRYCRYYYYFEPPTGGGWFRCKLKDKSLKEWHCFLSNIQGWCCSGYVEEGEPDYEI